MVPHALVEQERARWIEDQDREVEIALKLSPTPQLIEAAEKNVAERVSLDQVVLVKNARQVILNFVERMTELKVGSAK